MSNQYGYQPQAAPPKSGGALKVILIIVGVLIILCCGSAGIAIYMFYTGVTAVGAEVVKMAVTETPEANEAVGEIQSVKVNLADQSAEVVGSKGKGTVNIRKDGEGADLKMSDGRVIPLTLPDKPKLDAESETDDAEEPPVEPAPAAPPAPTP